MTKTRFLASIISMAEKKKKKYRNTAALWTVLSTTFDKHRIDTMRPEQIMITSSNGNISALLALCDGNPSVTGGFPSHSFDVFFDVRLNKRFEQTVEIPVIWYATTLIVTSL